VFCLVLQCEGLALCPSHPDDIRSWAYMYSFRDTIIYDTRVFGNPTLLCSCRMAEPAAVACPLVASVFPSRLCRVFCSMCPEPSDAQIVTCYSPWSAPPSVDRQGLPCMSWRMSTHVYCQVRRSRGLHVLERSVVSHHEYFIIHYQRCNHERLSNCWVVFGRESGQLFGPPASCIYHTMLQYAWRACAPEFVLTGHACLCTPVTG
jgi:hypothetical protein